jgi:hypothetical protein
VRIRTRLYAAIHGEDPVPRSDSLFVTTHFLRQDQNLYSRFHKPQLSLRR